MKHLSDEVYIEKVRAGNLQAYAMLVNKHKSMAFTLAYRITKSREDAEEVAQDSFLKVYHALPEFKGDSKFSTWLYRIIYNNSINKVRSKKNHLHIDDHDPEDISFAEVDEELKKYRQQERKHYIKQAVASLDGDESAVITLFYMQELSSAAICEITGLNDNNVRVKLHRARKKILLFLQRELKSELKELL